MEQISATTQAMQLALQCMQQLAAAYKSSTALLLQQLELNAPEIEANMRQNLLVFGQLVAQTNQSIQDWQANNIEPICSRITMVNAYEGLEYSKRPM